MNGETIKIETAGSTLYAPDWAAVASLHAKIAAAIGKIGAIGESATNKQDNYKYADYDDVAAPVRKALADVGLAQYAVLSGYTQTEEGKGLRTQAHFEFILADGATGAMIVCQWASEAMDYGMRDKGINKCATIAQKQWLKRALLVSTKEELDNDTDAGDERAKENEPRATPKAAAEKSGPWIEDDATRAKFWSWTNAQGLTHDEVHKALGVESVKVYAGSKEEAVAVIKAWIVAQAKQAEGE